MLHFSAFKKVLTPLNTVDEGMLLRQMNCQTNFNTLLKRLIVLNTSYVLDTACK